MKPNILIALPAYGGSVKRQCARSLVGLASEFSKHGINFTLSDANHSDIAEARNVFASLFLAKMEFTHLLFIDADIGFTARAVMRLVESKKDYIACAYRKRGDKPEICIDGKARPDSDGFWLVDGIGCGLCLISRAVVEQISSQTDLRIQTRHIFTTIVGKNPIFGFFDRIESCETLFGEDISFCHRWRQTGGVIHAIMDEPIEHIGEKIYADRPIDLITS